MRLHPTLLIAISFVFFLTEVIQAQVEVDSGAKVISSQPFQMPDAAVAAGIDGNIGIGFTVEKTGEAKNIRILAGPAWPCDVSKPKKEIEELLEAVKQNIQTARFSPAMKNGRPISSDVTITFSIGEAYKAAVRKREAEQDLRAGKIIKGGIVNGRALRLPKPAYPGAARSQRVTGTVSIEVLISEDGKVMRAGAISGHPLLQDDAREAACMAKFSPTVLEGQPVKVSGVITYAFMGP